MVRNTTKGRHWAALEVHHLHKAMNDKSIHFKKSTDHLDKSSLFCVAFGSFVILRVQKHFILCSFGFCEKIRSSGKLWQHQTRAESAHFCVPCALALCVSRECVCVSCVSRVRTHTRDTQALVRRSVWHQHDLDLHSGRKCHMFFFSFFMNYRGKNLCWSVEYVRCFEPLIKALWGLSKKMALNTVSISVV